MKKAALTLVFSAVGFFTNAQSLVDRNEIINSPNGLERFVNIDISHIKNTIAITPEQEERLKTIFYQKYKWLTSTKTNIDSMKETLEIDLVGIFGEETIEQIKKTNPKLMPYLTGQAYKNKQ